MSAATAAVIMGSAELAMLPSSPSFAATLGGAVNSHILVVDARKSANLKHEGTGTRYMLTLESQCLLVVGLGVLCKRALPNR